MRWKPGRTGRRNSSVVEDADRRSAIPRMRSCGRGALCGSNRRGRAPHDASRGSDGARAAVGSLDLLGPACAGSHEGWLVSGDEEVECRWIVARMARNRRCGALPASNLLRLPAPFRIAAPFRIEPWTDLVEAHWAHGVQAFVTPVGANEIDVAMLSTAILSCAIRTR